MSSINCDNILPKIKFDFGALWKCFKHGESIEVVAPHLYPNNSFVSIFITKRGDRYIATDGAMLSEYIRTVSDELSIAKTPLTRFVPAHGIKQATKAEKTYYYKDTTDIKLVSSIVFDLCNFIVATSNASLMLVDNEEEERHVETFRSEADNFLKSGLSSSSKKIHFRYNIPQIKEATFSAVINDNSRYWIVIYITGSKSNYFTSQVSNAIVNAEIAYRSSVKNNIAAIISLLNNQASGYEPRKLETRLGILSTATKREPVLWTEKDSLSSMLRS